MLAKRSEIVKIDKIVPYARNARTHSKEQIAQIRASFREFGVVAPLVVDEKYNLLVGHGRLVAA
ncbi:MAG: ParB N-terminal domain-containing protein, partial [Dethiobacter sp.]|nr:ParB N-terminal domain-containing protein [Dethiobacter sp.]